ncbi:DNA polymerase III subunit beta [Buchnera aphidicola]|uniref:DNA polymerase III subunit beta n=1 Tax=Buchnera aphidicola TaxID=9 RepID=UPI0022376A2D|nr:DNA polymerase III subunit beta [Buchnera aphidicola]MCW5197412.1 DNA polymerase III subunit beta [Buchnera aphidicola (Chaitophorus viminalis)]
MKCIVEKKDLTNPLQKINTLLIKNNPNEILGNILIEVKKSYILLISTNTEIQLIYKIPNKYHCITGKITVSGKKILDIFRVISEKFLIYIKIIDKKLYIYSKNSKFCLLTLPAKQFPYFKKQKYSKKFYIKQKIFKNMLEYTYFSMSVKDVRSYLNGIFIEFTQKYIRTIATNGHRIAIFKKKIKKNQSFPIFNIILPRKSAIELNKLLTKQDMLIKVLFNQNSIKIYINNIVFISKLINNNFPNLNHILSIKKKYKIQIKKKLLKKSLSHVLILVHSQLKGICLTFKKNICKITSDNQEEQARYKFKIKYKYTKKIKISININYLLDVLNVLKSDLIDLIFDKKIQFFEIQTSKKKELRYIILPLYL